jgi:hypothetical protein
VEDKLLKETYSKARKAMAKKGECPDEANLCRFAEGLMDEKEIERLEAHLVSCPACCNYVVALNRVIHFPAEEKLPDVTAEQIKKATQACAIELDKGIRMPKLVKEGFADQVIGFFKSFFSFDWLAQPLPVLVRSGAVALLLILIVSAGYVYYQQALPIGVKMEMAANTRIVVRGVPTEDRIQKIVEEGDILFSNDFCRINFELDKNAYVYVVHHDSKGALHQLYPDPAIADPPKVKGKTSYTIPEGKDNWFQLDDHTGNETIFLLASNRPIPDFNSTIDKVSGLSREEVAKNLEREGRIMKVLNFEHR